MRFPHSVLLRCAACTCALCRRVTCTCLLRRRVALRPSPASLGSPTLPEGVTPPNAGTLLDLRMHPSYPTRRLCTNASSGHPHTCMTAGKPPHPTVPNGWGCPHPVGTAGTPQPSQEVQSTPPLPGEVCECPNPFLLLVAVPLVSSRLCCRRANRWCVSCV